MYLFRVGHQYTRKEVFKVVGIKDPHGGVWYTGYAAHGNDWFIFCNVGTSGRTGHNYHNYFIGDELVWFGKNRTTIDLPSMKGLLGCSGDVYIFYREDNVRAFTFAGLGIPKQIKNSSPVEVIWAFATNRQAQPEILPQEITESEQVFEGAKKSIMVNVYERSPHARRKCIAHWGMACVVCGFDFEKFYGNIGEGFIHVHHLKPLSEIGEQYELDPVADLCPVCPNCHGMLHRFSPALRIEELKNILHAANAR